jgi:hypothetical protein
MATVVILTAGLAVSPLEASSATGKAGEPSESDRMSLRTLQDVVDTLKVQLDIREDVTAIVVDSHPLMVAVAPVRRSIGGFRLSLDATFIRELTPEELEAVIAHELGHVWIFTHHPYLQTEQEANRIALQVVERQALEKVYDRVWARKAGKGALPRFPDHDHGPRPAVIGTPASTLAAGM